MVGELCLFKNPDIEQLNMKEVICYALCLEI